MEVLVEGLSEVPKGCFVAVRLGENLKQRRFNKSTAKYNFPLPQEASKARIDVYQLVGTCSVQVDPAAAATEEVNAIGESDDATVKLRVSTCNKELKPEDAAKHKREIEAETKDAAVGYLAKHGIEDKLAECLRTMLRMKPENPVEFMCKFLRGGEPEETPPPAPPAPQVPQEAKPEVTPAAPAVEEAKPEVTPAAPAVEEAKPEVTPAAPAVEEAKPEVKPEAPPAPAEKPQQVTVEEPSKAEAAPRSSPDARAALMNSVRAGDLISALEEEETAEVPFALRPSVGTWLTPLQIDKAPEPAGPESGPGPVARRGSAETKVAEARVGEWLCAQQGSFNLKGLGKTSMECCEVERLLTKALMDMDGELQGEYFAMGSTHPLSPGGMAASEKNHLASQKLIFDSQDLSGRGVYLTEQGDVALWINADKHLQILVHSKAKQHLAHKIDMIVSALQGPLLQDGYTLSQ